MNRVTDTIAKKVTKRVLAVLIAAQVLIFAVSYLLIQRTLSDDAKEDNTALVTVYADMVTGEAAAQNVPIDENLAERLLSLGDFVCELKNTEFAYLFVPLPEPGRIRYICVSQNRRVDEINPYDRYIGKVTSYEMTEDELAVWNGEKEISHSITVSKLGHEISTMKRITDPYGNHVMAGVDQSYEDMNRRVMRSFSILAFATLLANAAVYFFVYLLMKKRVSVPAGKVCEAMGGFLSGGSCSKAKLPVSGSDEWAMISAAFNSMTEDIEKYLSSIGRLTKEQERQNAELGISSRIQRGFLKKNCYESGSFIIHADMITAKYVAGDLYDYMPLPDGRFLTVIADVSGKGVAASIFMAVTLVLIREFAKMKMSPAEIMRKVNDTLSDNNPSMLFLTAVAGIYDAGEKTYTYCNAGHNLPYILGDRVTELSGAQNSLLGLFPGEEFTEETVKLSPGETLFLYTDGVNEAVNESREFFGTKRLETALGEWISQKNDDPVAYVNKKLLEFTGKAERHDDTTMLSFLPSETAELILKPETSEFAKIKEKLLSLPVSKKERLDLCLSAEEIFINICSYAYKDRIEKGDVRVLIRVSKKIMLRFTDSGVPFDPTKDMIDTDGYDIDRQTGGLGRLIAFGSADDVKYEYKDGNNVLTLIKYCHGQKNTEIQS